MNDRKNIKLQVQDILQSSYIPFIPRDPLEVEMRACLTRIKTPQCKRKKLFVYARRYTVVFRF